MWHPYARVITEERVLLATEKYKGGVSTMSDRQYHLNFEYTTIHLPQTNNRFSINSYIADGDKEITLPHHHLHKQSSQNTPYI